jgi:DNA-directed RNA polymerase subunit RPC12/RpoP
MKKDSELHRVQLKCPVCGADKIPLDIEAVYVCDICGQSFEADTTCQNGHFVCHDCRQKAARQEIIRYCLAGKHLDPYNLTIELMQLPNTAMHGPEHHLLLTAALLTTYCNTLGRDDLPELLEEANDRSMQVPGGACGYWGICGAAIGAGIFLSLVSEASPFAVEEWKVSGQLTAKCAAAISGQGGPRCCKRDSFSALKEAVTFCNQNLNTSFGYPDITCQFYPNNQECKGKGCQFFPAQK